MTITKGNKTSERHTVLTPVRFEDWTAPLFAMLGTKKEVEYCYFHNTEKYVVRENQGRIHTC